MQTQANMEQDIAVASVADTILRQRGSGGGSGGSGGIGSAPHGDLPAGPLESSAPLVERFESMHQKVAHAAEQVARGGSGGGGGASGGRASGPLLSWARLRRPALWALAGAICVGALAVWMRPSVVMPAAEEGAADEEDASRRPSALKVVAVAAGAGVLVGGADLVGGARRG